MVRTADKPCWGLNGTDYRMGANGAVQGDINHYGDYVYSQEAMKIISEHDLQIPLYFCTHLPHHLSCMSPLVQTVHSIDRAVSADIAFQCNHEPIEAPDSYIEMVSVHVPAPFPSSFVASKKTLHSTRHRGVRTAAGVRRPVPPPRAFDRLTPCALWFARRRWHD